MEAEERPAGDHVHRHPGHDGDREERIDSMENKMLNKYLPEPVHHVCSVGFGDDLASEEK